MLFSRRICELLSKVGNMQKQQFLIFHIWTIFPIFQIFPKI